MFPRARWRERVRVGLAAKLALCLVASSAFLFLLFGVLNLRLQRQQSEELVLESAFRVADLIQRSTQYLMLRNDREALTHVLSTIGRESGIRRVRIFNKEGRVSFSTDAGEVDTRVDTRAETCTGCHAADAPPSELARSDRARVSKDPDGTRILGVIVPVGNSPECWSAPCHAHASDRRVLGVIDASLSLERVDAQVAAHQSQLVRFTALAMLLFSFVSVGFVWAVAHRPVRELIAGTRKVAAGDLAERLPVRSNDELGALASAFNKMTSDLEAAHAENVAWARTLEERVEQKTRELESAWTGLIASERMAALGKLAATVAHEVNNPLFGILTYARLLQKKLADESAGAPGVSAAPAIGARQEFADGLTVIERESRRCGEIVRNLLTYARQTPSRREPNDLNALVSRAVAVVRHQLEISNVTLETRLAEGLPAVSCDAGQIQQIVLALLVNAADAMPRGGTLEVASAIAPLGDAVTLSVRDDGVGIPADVLPRIFEPFFTTKEGAQRTGLGLAIAQSLVEQHGGSIAAKSAPGLGTEFVIRLPLASSAHPRADGTGAGAARR